MHFEVKRAHFNSKKNTHTYRQCKNMFSRNLNRLVIWVWPLVKVHGHAFQVAYIRGAKVAETETPQLASNGEWEGVYASHAECRPIRVPMAHN